MKTSTVAKIFGWFQFGMQAVAQVAQNGAPHGWGAWVVMIGSLATAVGLHAAAGTDGSK